MPRLSRAPLQLLPLLGILFAAGAAFAQPAGTGDGGQTLRGVVVCIDPGHGGEGISASYTGGWTGPVAKLREGEAALNVAILLRERFRAAGATVVMTRDRNRRVTPEGTSADEEQLARGRLASSNKADFFLSIHSSFSSNKSANATQVFRHPDDDPREEKLAESIGAAIAKAAGTEFKGSIVRDQKPFVEATMPALVIEATSLSNPEEEARLGRLAYCRVLADAIFQGFLAYWKEEEARRPAPRATPAPTPRARQATQAATPKPSETPRPRPRETPTPTPRPTPSPTPKATPAPRRAEPTPRPTSGSAIRSAKPTPRPSARATPDPRRPVEPPRATPRPTPSTTGRPSSTPTPRPAPRQTPRATPKPAPPVDRPVGYVALEAPMVNPVAGPIDQAWLYGESYGDLPMQRGVSFDVPDRTVVVAPAEGYIERVVAPGEPMVGFDDGDALAACDGAIVIRHDGLNPPYGEGRPVLTVYGNPYGEVGPVYTVYGNLAEVFVKAGERVAADDPIAKTLRPYDGRDESRATALHFEVRAGGLSPERAVNPEPWLAPLRGDAGAIALRLVDGRGAPARGVEIRGATKERSLYGRYAYSLTYGRGANSLASLRENAYIGDLAPGMVRLQANGQAKVVEVKPGMIAVVEWRVE